MGKRWVEGIHYSKKDDGSLECLRCHQSIKSLPGLGPHLSSCWPKDKGGRGVEVGESEGETLPEEHDALVQVLKDHGVKRRKAIADLMSYRSWDDYPALQQYLELSGVRVDRQKLILENWSQHRGSRLPRGLLESIRPVISYNRQGEGALTEARLKEILDKRDRQKEKKRELAYLKQRLDRLEKGNPGKSKSSEIQQLREEIKEMRQSDLMKRLDRLEKNTTASDPLIQMVKSTENILRDIRSDIKPLRFYLLTGKLPYEVQGKSPKMEVEEGARKGIFSRIPKEYVAEE